MQRWLWNVQLPKQRWIWNEQLPMQRWNWFNFWTIPLLIKSWEGVRLTWLDCNLPITYLSIRQSMPCLMCKPLEHIWLISFVFGQFVIIIQTNCFWVSLKIRQAASQTIKLFFNIFYDDSTQCVKMMKQNSVCLRFRFNFFLLLGYTHH